MKRRDFLKYLVAMPIIGPALVAAGVKAEPDIGPAEYAGGLDALAVNGQDPGEFTYIQTDMEEYGRGTMPKTIDNDYRVTATDCRNAEAEFARAFGEAMARAQDGIIMENIPYSREYYRKTAKFLGVG